MKRPLSDLTEDQIKQAWLYADWIGRMRKLYISTGDKGVRETCTDEAANALRELMALGQEDLAIDMHENEVDKDVIR